MLRGSPIHISLAVRHCGSDTQSLSRSVKLSKNRELRSCSSTSRSIIGFSSGALTFRASMKGKLWCDTWSSPWSPGCRVDQPDKNWHRDGWWSENGEEAPWYQGHHNLSTFLGELVSEERSDLQSFWIWFLGGEVYRIWSHDLFSTW